MSDFKKAYLAELPTIVKAMEAMRLDRTNPTDITLSEMVKEHHSVSMEAYYSELGINPNQDTIQNLLGMPDNNYRWLIPEIYRDALRLGIRKAPIYPSLIASEQTVSQTTVNMPAINMSDAAPKKLGVAETIPLGDVSFDQKQVKIYKIGRGIKIPDEVKNYVPLNLVSLYMQDVGTKMGMALDYLALTTAVNGDQADGSDAAPIIGMAASGTLTFKDVLKPWFRMSRLGRVPSTQIAGEDMAMELTELYLATRLPEGQQRVNVNLKTPLPQQTDLYVHGAIAANQMLMLDRRAALIKLNAQPLLVETERIVSNQTEGTYATITTGFATLFRDGRMIIKKDVAFAASGFDQYPFLDPTPFEVVPLTKK